MKRLIQTAVICLFFIFTFSTTICAQNFWVKKSYEKWDLGEAMKILSNSPWAQTAHEVYYPTESQSSTTYLATIRLHSALPLRQAIVQKMRLTTDYDKLDAIAKQKFDEEVTGLLNCNDCSKYYVVNLILPKLTVKGSGNSDTEQFGSDGVEMRRELMKLKLEELQKYVSLTNDKEESRVLYQVIFPKGKASEVLFIFKRNDENDKPLITKANKKFYFNIDAKAFSKSGWPFKKFTFEVSKILQNDEIMF